jgi:hypothetical protein
VAAVTFSSAREPVIGGPQPHRRLSSYEFAGRISTSRSDGAGAAVFVAWGSDSAPAARAGTHLDARDDHPLTGLVTQQETQETPHRCSGRISATLIGRAIPRTTKMSVVGVAV